MAAPVGLNDKLYDVIGVGFGPSNVALAIALQEKCEERKTKYNHHYIEKQSNISWHEGMLLPNSLMQISFIKDLVTLRNPTSPFTFINYLQQHGRLVNFVNCKTFYPTRVEFNEYLRWAASSFKSDVSVEEEVLAVEPCASTKNISHLKITSKNSGNKCLIRYAKNLAVAVGGSPHIPGEFQPLVGHPRCVHSSKYLNSVGRLIGSGEKSLIGIVGGGQSAAEIAIDLLNRDPNVMVELLVRNSALRPADSSPFVNEIFSPEQVDKFHYLSEEARRQHLIEFRNTNYGVVDSRIISELYSTLYRQSFGGRPRLNIRFNCELVEAASRKDYIEVTHLDNRGGTSCLSKYDGIILATGYQRSELPTFLDPIKNYAKLGSVGRNYNLVTDECFEPKIYMQGYCEKSHGLSDTLLSTVSTRSSEIADSLLSNHN